MVRPPVMTMLSVLSTLLALKLVVGKQPPHIVFIVADDLGFSDIGFRNPYFSSPYIDSLATTGVILNQSYVQPVGSPSRSAWMSGLHPFKTGLQHLGLMVDEPTCLPLERKLLPQYMKDLGYATHMVGKWHLGFCNWKCTPTNRGFDSYFGYYNGMEDYYNHTKDNYLDFRDGKNPADGYNGTYSALLFAEKADMIITKHNASQPLFLYLPFQSVHYPVEVPEYYESRCSTIKDAKRRTLCGMVAAMDAAIIVITQALLSREMYDNSIIIFTTDNGGSQLGSGYNYPLRGEKGTIWEGGTRATAFVHSPLLTKTNYTSNGMLHATDWFSTIIGLGGGEAPSDVDGIDQSDLILNAGDSKRTEFIYNIDNTSSLLTYGRAGIRMGEYKLLVGEPGSLSHDKWFVPPEYKQTKSKTQQTRPQILEEAPREQLYLFNVKDDPEERNNLYHQLPDVVETLSRRLDWYRKQMVPALNPGKDPDSNPEKYGGVWSPGWC